MADGNPSEWEETEDSEEEKRRGLKRTLVLYALAAGALSIALPLAGLLYVRMNSKTEIPVPQAARIFTPAQPLSPAQKAMLPASPSVFLPQQQGKGSLSYVRGDLGYAPPTKPKPAPKAAPQPPSARKPAPKVAAAKPKRAKSSYKPFTPPTLDQGFGSQQGFGAGQQTNPLSILGGAMPNIGSLLKNLPSSIGKSLGGLGNLGGLSRLMGPSQAPKNGGQQAGASQDSAPTTAAPQLNGSNGL
ncbi:MAG TPA: hypothetical protein VNK24_08325 [Elusimicrobiota bacterium]|nr:hypothetical protein [Elusimicrobiota bacterium]